MNTDIFIAGAGQTSFGEHWDKSLPDLMQEAIDAALEDSPCTALDVDMIVVANMIGQGVSGQGHLGAIASEFLPHHPPALRVESACASGTVAVHTTCGLLESGRCETILVVGVEKMTDASTEEVSAALMGAADAERDAPSGLTFPGIFGLITKRYMHEHGLTREQLNIVSSRHHEHATKNPFAQFKMAIAPEKISQSAVVAEPLHLLDCSPISDGAAAMVLSTKFESDNKIVASQLATDAVSLTKRPTITSFSASRDAANKAYEEADIQPHQISHLEVHDCFSMAAVINVEDLGFAKPGEGIKLYEQQDPSPTINLSGGLKACGHPVAATGIKQIIDIGKQLRHSKGRLGLAQNFGGACATCGVHIVEHVPTS